ncbi:MAG: hypothetical protein HZA90_10205 [Verrucomicrobia bacterium]|nr:hypothetical protein [Verrucomicrobiota bacterium]
MTALPISHSAVAGPGMNLQPDRRSGWFRVAFLLRPAKRFFPLALALSLVSSSSSLTAQGQTSSPPADAAPPTAPKAVFTDDPQFGRDPFFPNSVRRAREMARVNASAAFAQPANLLSQLTLKGISIAKGRRLALINNVTFAAGETVELKVNAENLRVRCVEIRDRSVIVALDGSKDARELTLRKGL